MTIEEIYSKYNVPPNLQDHLILVAKITNAICAHWTASDIHPDIIVKLALLHDIGNIVKFDFVNHPEFLGDEIKNLNYWKEKQALVIQRYGTNDHEVTNQILKELNIEDKYIQIILNKSFSNSIEIKESNDWPLKILAYSDFRVTPKGIDSLTNRLTEVMTRLPKYTERFDLLTAAQELEHQIQEKVDTDLKTITDRLIEERYNIDLSQDISIITWFNQNI